MKKEYHQLALIFSAIILIIVPIAHSSFEMAKENSKSDETGYDLNDMTDDELSFALSSLSVDDLNALSELLDGIDQKNPSRAKRENAIMPTKDDESVDSIPQQDDEYIRQLEDSFPNVVEQSNKEKDHIRVKRT